MSNNNRKLAADLCPYCDAGLVSKEALERGLCNCCSDRGYRPLTEQAFQRLEQSFIMREIAIENDLYWVDNETAVKILGRKIKGTSISKYQKDGKTITKKYSGDLAGIAIPNYWP